MKPYLLFVLILLSLASVSQQRYNSNQRVEVEKNGGWQQVVILKPNGKGYLVHYPGSSSTYDETVPIARIRMSADERKRRASGRKTVVVLPTDYTAFILGEWTGEQYIGQKPAPNQHSHSTGIGSGPPIYDSARIEIKITEVKGNKFSGVAYGYLPSDPDNNFYRGSVEGWLSDSMVHIKGTVATSKLQKYSGSHWCDYESDFNLTTDLSAYHIEGTPPPGPCRTGYMDLHKLKITARPAASTVQKGADAIIENYQQRGKVVLQTIEIKNADVQLKFYDNKQVDGDSISIFINDKLVATHVRLDVDPFIIKYNFPDTLAEAQVSMFAENLGSIPPNTAAIQIIDGTKKYYIIMKSNLAGSAVVKLLRKR